MVSTPTLLAVIVIFLAIVGFLVYFLVFQNDDSTDSKCSTGKEYKNTDGNCTACTLMKYPEACKQVNTCTSDADASCTECINNDMFDKKANCAPKGISDAGKGILSELQQGTPDFKNIKTYFTYVLGNNYPTCDFDKIINSFMTMLNSIEVIKDCIEGLTEDDDDCDIKNTIGSFQATVMIDLNAIIVDIQGGKISNIPSQLQKIQKTAEDLIDHVTENCINMQSCTQNFTEAGKDLKEAIEAFKDCLSN